MTEQVFLGVVVLELVLLLLGVWVMIVMVWVLSCVDALSFLLRIARSQGMLLISACLHLSEVHTIPLRRTGPVEAVPFHDYWMGSLRLEADGLDQRCATKYQPPLPCGRQRGSQLA